MKHLDAEYVEDLVRRLNRIQPNDVPRWGQLRRDSLIEHFLWVVLHSMGRSHKVPHTGNWFTRRILGPLFIRGLIPIPRNLQLPKALRNQGVEMREPGDLESLHALLKEYLNLVQADELKPGPHPAFGDISIDDWEQIHLQHFEYHLNQFGV